MITLKLFVSVFNFTILKNFTSTLCHSSWEVEQKRYPSVPELLSKSSLAGNFSFLVVDMGVSLVYLEAPLEYTDF